MFQVMKSHVKIQIALFLAITSVLLFYNCNIDASFDTVIENSDHLDVFKYVSTIDNLPILNPTILKITNRRHINETHFVIDYAEYLSQIPIIENYATGFYNIVKKDDSYSIYSQHTTCFYTNYLCLPTTSCIRISQEQSHVVYQENITYSCPWILSKFCFNEVFTQRKFIFDKLKEIFSK